MPTAAYSFKVTAIVSIYKAERFFRACLEDLVRQTIFDQTEVIIIDACSPENEATIAHEFTQRYPNITYFRTAERETLYASWNRALGMAKGQYITNANADDRHAPHCFERLSAELDAHPELGMVYAQCRVTSEENATFESAPVKRLLHWLPYDHINLIRCCEVGPQPMWRASVHEQLGFFDETCTVCGDHDMWLRISEHYPMRYIPEELGLYLEYEGKLESSNPQRAYDEELKVKRLALQRFMDPAFRPHVPFAPQLRTHTAALAGLLDNLRSGGNVENFQQMEFHFYAYALLVARSGNIASALDLIDMFFDVMKNSKNMCQLYKFLLLTSQGEHPGSLRVEQAVDAPPLVSVVVPLYNQGHFLAEAVASVLAQTEPRWEMIIVNDGSTDDSLPKAKKVLARYNDPRIRLVSQANAGKGPTRNRGVRETSAPFVCILDADNMLVPTYFRTALDMLAETPDAGWACPRTLVFGSNNHIAWNNTYNFFDSLLQCPCPVTALYRRTIWDDLGGYVESMIDREDWEFWVRAGEAGWTGITTSNVEFIYRHAFQRFGQMPKNNLRSKQQYMALHPWWFKRMPQEHMRQLLSAYSVDILPQEVLQQETVDAVRPLLGKRQEFAQAVQELKTSSTQRTKSKNALQDVTMAIFTFNRSHMIQEIVNYHAPTGMRIVILDASESPVSLANAEATGENVTVYHLPGTTHIERLAWILQRVDTPYFVFRADRRHYSNEFLWQGTDFLRSNADYASAAGIWLSEGTSNLYHCDELASKNGELEDPYLRMENQVLSYQPSYYNVHRTEDICALSNILMDIAQKTNNLYYHEYVQAFTTSLCGKTKQLPCVAGIIQNLKKEINYGSSWPKTTELFADEKLSLFLAESLVLHLKHKNFDKAKMCASVLRAIDNASLRFLFYRINILDQTKGDSNTYTYFEKIFALLNAKKSCKDDAFLEKALRVLAGMAFEKDVTYAEVKHLFSKPDLREQASLFELIERCHKQKILADIRLKKKQLLR